MANYQYRQRKSSATQVVEESNTDRGSRLAQIGLTLKPQIRKMRQSGAPPQINRTKLTGQNQPRSVLLSLAPHALPRNRKEKNCAALILSAILYQKSRDAILPIQRNVLPGRWSFPLVAPILIYLVPRVAGNIYINTKVQNE